jgi:tetratricopeptide (TPR) repeat protein
MNQLLPRAAASIASANNVNDSKSLDEAFTLLLDNADRLRQRGELSSAISTAEHALQLAQNASAPRLIALAQLDLGNLHRYAPNAVESIRFLHAAEEHFRSTSDPLLAKALARQGMTLGDMGDHTRALELYQEALTSIEAQGMAGDAGLAATCFGAIGVSCTQLDDFEQAEAAYQRAIPLFEHAKNHESVCFI